MMAVDRIAARPTPGLALRDALGRDRVDDDLLDRATDALRTLIEDGRPRPLEAHPEGVQAIRHYLRHVAMGEPRLSRLLAVAELERWLGERLAELRAAAPLSAWTPDVCRRLLVACRWILGEPRWRQRLETDLEAGDAEARQVAAEAARALDLLPRR